MTPFTWARWLRSFCIFQGFRRPVLLPLAVPLPAPLVSNPRSIGAGFGPSLAMDPVNPQKLVEVSNALPPTNSTIAAPVGRYSLDGGANWTTFNLPANLNDPNLTAAPTQFSLVSNPSVAFDRNEAFNVTYTEHDPSSNSGVLLLQMFSFGGATPVQAVSNNIL